MVKIQEIGNKHHMFITVPKRIAKIKDWKKGTELEWSFDRQGNIFIEDVGKLRETQHKQTRG